MNEKNTKNQKSTANIAVSIVLFVFVALAVIFAVRQFIYCHEDVLSAIDQGMSITENLGDIFFYYLESCGQYLFTGAILFGLGWVIMHQGKTASSVAVSNAANSQYSIDLQQTDNSSSPEKNNDESDEGEKNDVDKYTEE